MKLLLALALTTFFPVCTEVQASQPDYASCDQKAPHALREVGDDASQAHIAMRADVLQADIGNARKARRIGQARADGMFDEIAGIRRAADGLTRQQGFLSAAERATYDRRMDAIAAVICGPHAAGMR